jgi:hypothetical protein
MLVHKGVPPYRKGGQVIELEPGEVVAFEMEVAKVDADFYGKSIGDMVEPLKQEKETKVSKPRSKKK